MFATSIIFFKCSQLQLTTLQWLIHLDQHWPQQKINFPSTELASKSNTDFDIDCYKIWSSMLDLVSILSLTFNIRRLSEQLARFMMTESPEIFSAIWSIPLQKDVGFFSSPLLFSLICSSKFFRRRHPYSVFHCQQSW